MEDKYFIIYNGDGDTTVEQMDKAKVLTAIKEERYGPVEILDEMPDNADTNYWGENLLIIRGEIVVLETIKIE